MEWWSATSSLRRGTGRDEKSIGGKVFRKTIRFLRLILPFLLRGETWGNTRIAHNLAPREEILREADRLTKTFLPCFAHSGFGGIFHRSRVWFFDLLFVVLNFFPLLCRFDRASAFWLFFIFEDMRKEISFLFAPRMDNEYGKLFIFEEIFSILSPLLPSRLLISACKSQKASHEMCSPCSSQQSKKRTEKLFPLFLFMSCMFWGTEGWLWVVDQLCWTIWTNQWLHNKKFQRVNLKSVKRSDLEDSFREAWRRS